MKKSEKKIILTDLGDTMKMPTQKVNPKSITLEKPPTPTTTLPTFELPNPLALNELIDKVVDISNNLISLGAKIQETAQLKEQTKQVVAKANSIITQEIELTNRMMIELEKEKSILQNDLEKYRMDTDVALTTLELSHEMNIKNMDLEYAKFKDKMKSFSDYLDVLLKNYNNLEASISDEPELRELLLRNKAPLREDIFKILSLISNL